MRRDTAKVDGEAIRRLRAKKEWTQQELAGHVGCHKRLVQKLEAGGSAKLETIRDFAEALGVDQKVIMQSDTPVEMRPIVQEASLAISLQEAADPVLIRYFGEAFQKAAIEYQTAKNLHKTAPGVGYYTHETLAETFGEDRFLVYFVPGRNKYGHATYVYAISPQSKHSHFMEALDRGEILEEALIIAMGLNTPSEAVRNTIYQYYGFLHQIIKPD